MGLSSRLSLHARYRHGADCQHDLGKAEVGQSRWRGNQRRALAGLILWALAATPALADSFRIALFHTEFSRDGPGLLYRDLVRAKDDQIEAGLRVLAHIDADILVLGGIDHDHDHHALVALAERLGGYPFRFQRAPNRGVPSGADLNRDGRPGGPDDALGYGEFRGAEGVAILSKYPLQTDKIDDRTDRRWHDLTGNIAPPETHPSERVSTTVHLRIPVVLSSGRTVEIVTWHATPPVFDGPEDRNGRRNHDETRLALDLAEAATNPIIVAGFANLDPMDGDGRPEALHALLSHPTLWDRPPTSEGGPQASRADGGANTAQQGDPAFDTVDWPDGDDRPGNLRVDYLIPDRALTVVASGVFWPAADALFGSDVVDASRHRVVWMDLVPNRPHQH